MKRYPIGPLVEAMGMPAWSAMAKLGVSGSTWQKYRDDGVLDQTAELLSIRAGFHPFEIWPELLDDRAAEASGTCPECGDPFIPNPSRAQKYCDARCRHRAASRRYAQRKYQGDPVWRERRRSESLTAWRTMGPAARRARLARMAELRSQAKAS